MHKVDSSGATVGNEFTDGNPATQTPRTRLQAKFMNTVMYELANVVLQAGIALLDTDNTQLIQSVPIAVSTIAALRACPAPVTIPNTRQVTAWVRGSAADGDGAGAMFRWVYNSVAADDGVLVVRPATNPAQGRWLRCPVGFASSATNAAQLGGVAASSYALLNSPALTGTPTGPTAAAGTNNTQLANTAFVQAALAALVNSSPAALDTLSELAAALGNDSNFATTMTNALAGKSAVGHTHTWANITDVGTQFANSAASPGYLRIPPGWYLQGGTTGSIAGGGGAQSITFPISFPSTCLAVVATSNTAGGTAQAESFTSSVSASGFTMNNAANVSRAFKWFSFGF